MLLGLDVHTIIIRWIAAALFQRKVVLRCCSWSSEPMIICPGLPQGSPLSPVLFNMYTVAITDQQWDGRGRTLSFADDILVYRQDSQRQEIAKSIQSELNRLSSSCVDPNTIVNPTNASVTWFSLNYIFVQTDMPTGWRGY
jgi:hypothetical protein